MSLPLAVYLFGLLSLTSCIPFEEFEPAWKEKLASTTGSRSGFSKDLNDYAYPSPVESYAPPKATYGSTSYDNSSSPYLSLIPGSGLTESEVKCGQNNKNFCNYPELPFIETLNIPQVLASPNRLNRLPSGKCPHGYTKQPTFDCLNVAPAFIETTCCVFDTVPVTLTDFCSNRGGLLFTASFELCDGRNFIIADSNAWQVDENFKILGGPYALSTLTGGTVSSAVDSALVDSSCNVGFFQGKNLRWMNFPDRTANTDKTLLQLLGTIPSNLCGNVACTATSVNFAVCPNNGFCMVSVNLTTAAGTVYQQLFLLAPGFNSFITNSQTPPGIAVENSADLSSAFKNYMAASFVRTTNQLAFIDRSNNVFYYDPTGKFISGPKSLFDLFGICNGVGSTPSNKSPYTLYIPYPIYPVHTNSSGYSYPPAPMITYSQPASYPSSAPSNQYQPNSYSQPQAQTYDQPYAQPAPSVQYKSPAPPTYNPAPAPSYQPTPAPVKYEQQPQYNQQPPAYATPAPYTAPSYTPAPVKYEQQPQYNQQPPSYATTTPYSAPYYTPTPVKYEQAPQYAPAPQPQFNPATVYTTASPIKYDQPAPTNPAPYQSYQPATQMPVKYEQAPQYPPAPQPPYNPAPVYTTAPPIKYEQPVPSNPAPYQVPVKYEEPKYQPAPAPQYVPTVVKYEPAPAPYNPPQQYQPAPAPSQYQQQYNAPAPQYVTPAPYNPPAPEPYKPAPTPTKYEPTPAPYNPPVTQSPIIYQPAPLYVTPAPMKYEQPAPAYATATPVPYYRPEVPEYTPPKASYVAPYSTPYLTEISPKPMSVIKSDLNENTVFKPHFAGPSSEFFDLSGFVRKGDMRDGRGVQNAPNTNASVISLI